MLNPHQQFVACIQIMLGSRTLLIAPNTSSAPKENQLHTIANMEPNSIPFNGCAFINLYSAFNVPVRRTLSIYLWIMHALSLCGVLMELPRITLAMQAFCLTRFGDNAIGRKRLSAHVLRTIIKVILCSFETGPIVRSKYKTIMFNLIGI